MTITSLKMANFMVEQLQAENAALKAELEQEAQQYEDLRQDYDKSLTELDALKAELADRVSPGMVMVLKATIRELTDELAAAQKDAARPNTDGTRLPAKVSNY